MVDLRPRRRAGDAVMAGERQNGPMSRVAFPHPIRRLLLLAAIAALAVPLPWNSVQAADESRLAFDYFSIAPPPGWRVSIDEERAGFFQQMPPNDFSSGCSLGIGSAYKSSGSLKSDLAAYEYHALPGNFVAEPPKSEKLENGWELVARVYRNRYSPSIHKVVVLANRGSVTQSMTWELTGGQPCQRAFRASIDTLRLLPDKRRMRPDGSQIPFAQRAPVRSSAATQRSTPTQRSSTCKAPSTTCVAPVSQVGSACTCHNYRGLLEMGTIMP